MRGLIYLMKSLSVSVSICRKRFWCRKKDWYYSPGIQQRTAGRVMTYDSLTVDFSSGRRPSILHADFVPFLILNTNIPLPNANRQLNGLETVLLFTETEYSFISSTVVRDLIGYGKDITAFYLHTLNFNIYIRNSSEMKKIVLPLILFCLLISVTAQTSRTPEYRKFEITQNLSVFNNCIAGSWMPTTWTHSSTANWWKTGIDNMLMKPRSVHHLHARRKWMMTWKWWLPVNMQASSPDHAK